MNADPHRPHAGIIVIWNDILPAARDDFLEWHSREHIPERVATPGFGSGQRWFGDTASPAYLTIYETAGIDVLTSAPYLARLNDPTPWTQRAVAAFRNTSRAAGSLVWQSRSSCALGGNILTARVLEPVDDPQSLIGRWGTSILPAIAAAAGVARVRLTLTAASASQINTAERKVRVGDMQEPSMAILVEGFASPVALRVGFAQATADERLLRQARIDLYALQFELRCA